MKPDIQTFESATKTYRGNLSKVAAAFGVRRCTVGEWVREDKEFRAIVNDARMRLFDDCIAVSEVVAMGIPEKDTEGKLIGWRDRPDGNMLRYLMSTLGRYEGFGESLDVTTNGKDINIPVFRVLTKKEIEEFPNEFDKEY